MITGVGMCAAIGAAVCVVGVVFCVVGFAYWVAFFVCMSPRTRFSGSKIHILQNFWFLGLLIIAAGLALMETARRVK